MERRDIFISYTKKDTEQAVWIANVLKSHGYTVYIQQLDIKPGDNFLEKMNEFLKNSDNFLAVWSKAYSKSKFCMTEMQAAFHEWHKGRINGFLPVRIENYAMEPLYAAMVHADLFDLDTTEAEQTLISAVRSLFAHSESETETESEEPSAVGFLEKVSAIGNLVWDFIVDRIVPIVTILLLVACVFAVQSGKFPTLGDLRTLFKVESQKEENRELSGAELCQIGTNYYVGINGVAVDYEQARIYYEQAAEKGNADALNYLGQLYRKGHGVEVNYEKAREYYAQAAEKGNDSALNNLGNLYDDGDGVEQDYTKAREYYEQAAEKGNTTALNNLGFLYEEGHGVEQDYTKAREYYEKAAGKGNATALSNLGFLYEEGHGVEQDYTKAREYYAQAAAKGNAGALNRLGVFYDNGLGVDVDYNKAREYYEKAAEKGHEVAPYNLGGLYEYGCGVDVNYPKAIEYYQQAAHRGYEKATARAEELRAKLDE